MRKLKTFRKRRVMQAVKVGDAIVHRDKIGKCRDSAPYLISYPVYG